MMDTTSNATLIGASRGEATFTWETFARDAKGEGWASTDRGWVRLAPHPDDDEDPPEAPNGPYVSRCVGNYLDYGPYGYDAPAIHFAAYIHRLTRGGVACQRIGTGWVRTVDEAKAQIERLVREHLARAEE